jgi:hypothetical protein
MRGRRARAIETAPGPAVAAQRAERPTGLRLARLHLRMGSLSLARAELEAYAGRGSLDEDALADLAEARWRTGDLAGAGEAAAALLETGRTDPVAMVIAAEAVAAQGRPGEARRLAARALEHLGAPLDQVFAGIVRSSIWPSDPAGALPAIDEPPRATADDAAARPAAEGPAAATASLAMPQAAEDTPSAAGLQATLESAAALAGGLAALQRTAIAQAATALSVALRLDPSAAEEILEAVGPGPWTDPALALVAGDALAALGRLPEAQAAWSAAAGLFGPEGSPGPDGA